MSERERPVQINHPRCPFCHEAVEPAHELKRSCEACMAWHHGECWEEHGACSACGVESKQQVTSPCGWPDCSQGAAPVLGSHSFPFASDLVRLQSGEAILIGRLCADHAAEGLRLEVGLIWKAFAFLAIATCVLAALSGGTHPEIWLAIAAMGALLIAMAAYAVRQTRRARDYAALPSDAPPSPSAASRPRPPKASLKSLEDDEPS